MGLLGSWGLGWKLGGRGGDGRECRCLRRRRDRGIGGCFGKGGSVHG